MMNAWALRDVKVEIETSSVLAWVLTAAQRTEEDLLAHKGDLSQALGDPAIAAEMVESLASGRAQTQADLRSEDQQRIAALAQKVRELRDGLATLRHYAVGLQHAQNRTVEVALEAVHALAPEDTTGVASI